jgi:2-keto-4-pentenoate hydratase
MPPSADQIAWMGRALAQARRAGTLVDLPLTVLATDAEAEATQIKARDAMDDRPRGYTTLMLRERLGTWQADTFVHGPLMGASVRDAGAPFRVPEGLLGARCALLFTMGRSLPDTEAITRRGVVEAIARCDLAIDLVGRRVPESLPLTSRSATADFALHVATFRGPAVARWSDVLWTDTPIVLAIDGRSIHLIAGSAILAHALDCLARLVEAVSRGGGALDAGALVCAGWRIPARRLRAGQALSVSFADAGSLTVPLA